MKDENWVAKFEKPNTSPNSLTPSTTVLSPYLKFGNLSARVFYFKLKEIYRKKPTHSKPPVSLEGQLLWREFFYFTGAFTPNFDKIIGNPICKKINWEENDEFFQAWKHARTGYPFIDAIMTQLRTEGWIHHLARHAVACFLTRGDLYQSWTKGVDVFEEWLLDSDWSLNAANWMWLSASAFFHQYFRVYSPIVFGKKTDKNGDYIRKYLPVLKNYPTEFIYEPWTAPLSVQKQAKCVIGQDYPRPIVDHAIVSKRNIAKMKAAYDADKDANTDVKIESKSTLNSPVESKQYQPPSKKLKPEPGTPESSSNKKSSAALKTTQTTLKGFVKKQEPK
jgi:cryptochrome